MRNIGRLIKYLLKYKALILMLFIFEFIFISADVNLPNIMSDIVNTGIQKHGIKDNQPNFMTKNDFDLILKPLDDKEKNNLTSAYNAVENYSNKKYDISNESLFVNKNNIDTTSEIGRSIIFYNKLTNKKNIKLNELSKIDLSFYTKDEINNASKISSEAPKSERKEITLKYIYEFYINAKVNVSKLSTEYIWGLGRIMLVLAFIVLISVIVIAYLNIKISANAAFDIRNDFYKKTLSLSGEEVEKFSISSLLTRATADIDAVQGFFSQVLNATFLSPLTIIIASYMAWQKSPSLIVYIICPALVIAIILISVMQFVIPLYKKWHEFFDKINAVVREQITGNIIVKSLGRVNFEKNRFMKINQALSKLMLRTNITTAIMSPISSLISTIGVVLIIWFGVKQIESMSMNIGDLMAFLQYASKISASIFSITMIFWSFPSTFASWKRIIDVLRTKNEIVGRKKSKPVIKNKIGEIQFKNVYYKFQNAEDYALENISFTVKRGKTTAIVGSTGSGKSTLVSLLPRLHDITKGNIFVNGIDIKDYNLTDLRSNFGFVSQKTKLLSGTIKSNIAFSNNNLSEESIIEAADISEASQFIADKAHGINEEISQNGTNISGGQKQRLSIARAIARKANILIFDDSFSALDYKTDSKIRKSLDTHAKGTTKIIIAQRISSILNADQIIVLHDGYIVGKGKHSDLMKTCKDYQEIANSQLSSKELKNV